MVHVELDLPPIPAHIKQDICKFVDEYLLTWTPTSDAGYYEVYGTEEINIIKRSVLYGWEHKELTDFVKSVCPQITKVSLFLLANDTTSPAEMPTHTDFNRELGVNYIIDTGGDNVETFFFEQVYDPPMIITNGLIRARYFNEKNLVKTDSIIFKKDSWVAFDGQKPHSVKNITGKRILVSMSMDYTLDEIVMLLPNLIKK